MLDIQATQIELQETKNLVQPNYYTFQNNLGFFFFFEKIFTTICNALIGGY